MAAEAGEGTAGSIVDPFWTIITGVLVFVIAQTAKAVMVDPAMEQRKVIGEIDYNLIYLAQWYANPHEYEKLTLDQRAAHERAGDTLRQLASRLAATTRAIVGYGLWDLTTMVPPRDAVDRAIGGLILLSNSIYKPGPGIPEKGERNSDYAEQIRILLGRRPFSAHFRIRLGEWKQRLWTGADDHDRGTKGAAR